MVVPSKSSRQKAAQLCRLFLLLAASLLLSACALPIPIGSTSF